MIVKDETKQILRQLGLANYEITTYLFLLGASPQTAEQVSGGAKLPTRKSMTFLRACIQRDGLKSRMLARKRIL